MNHQTHSLTTDELLRHSGFMRSLAHGLLVDGHRAEDVSQEAWVRALESPPSNPGSLRSWLGSVTRNLSWNANRSRSHRIAREQGAARTESVPGADEGVMHADLLRNVVLAVHDLKEPYRKTVLEHFFEGLSLPEIAARSGTAVSTVRSRLQKALDTLRIGLSQNYAGAPAGWAGPLAALTGLSSTSKSSGALVLISKIAAVLAVVSLGAYVWMSRSSESPQVNPTGSIGASAGALPASLAGLELDPVQDPGQRTPVPASVPDGKLRVTVNVSNLPYAPLGLVEGPGGGLNVRLGLDKPDPFAFGELGKAAGTTDEQGKWTVLIEDPGTRPLQFSVLVDPNGIYRRGSNKIVVEDKNTNDVEVLASCTPHGLLNGQVVDVEGKPLEGIELSFRNRNEEHTVTSNAKGEFQLAGLSVAYLKRVGDPSYTIYERGTSNPVKDGGWEPMTVTLVQAGVLRLNLTGLSSKPLAGAKVTVSLSEAERSQLKGNFGFGGGGDSHKADTDEDGLAVVHGVWSGKDLMVKVRHNEQTAKSEWMLDGELRFEPEIQSAQPLRLNADGVLELKASWNDQLQVQGSVVYADGRPTALAKVQIYNRSEGSGWDEWKLIAGVDSDEQGHFELPLHTPGVPAQLLVLATSPDAGEDPGKAPAPRGLGYMGTAPLKAASGEVGRLYLDPRQAKGGLLQADVRLAPIYQIQGRLIDEDGNPRKHRSGTMAGHRISVTPAGANSHMADTSLAPLQKVSYDKVGDFSILGLAEGEYDVWVTSEMNGFYTFSVGLQRFPNIAAGTSGIELVMKGTPKVQVRIHTNVDPAIASRIIVLHARHYPAQVLDKPTGTAQRAFQVDGTSGWPARGSYSFTGIGGMSDATGHTQLGYYSTKELATHELPAMGPGWYSIGVQPSSKEGRPYLPAASKLVYLEEGAYEFTFDLLRTTDVEGRVRSATTRRLALELKDASGRSIPLEVKSGYTKPSTILSIPSDGHFRLRNVPIGEYVLRAGTPAGLAKGQALAQVNVRWTLTDNPTTVIDLP